MTLFNSIYDHKVTTFITIEDFISYPKSGPLCLMEHSVLSYVWLLRRDWLLLEERWRWATTQEYMDIQPRLPPPCIALIQSGISELQKYFGGISTTLSSVSGSWEEYTRNWIFSNLLLFKLCPIFLIDLLERDFFLSFRGYKLSRLSQSSVILLPTSWKRMMVVALGVCLRCQYRDNSVGVCWTSWLFLKCRF